MTTTDHDPVDTPVVVDADPPVKGGSGFYLPRAWGLFGLGPVGSVIAGIGAFLLIASLLTPYRVVLPLLIIAVGVVALGLFVRRDRHHRTWVQRHRDKTQWKAGGRIGATSYRPSVLTDMGQHKLPGALALSELHEYTTIDGETFAVQTYPTTHCYVVSASAEPDGASLLDESELGKRVENWGHYIAGWALEPDFLQGIITIETAPDSGPLMQAAVRGSMSPRSSEVSRRVTEAILGQYPQGSQGVNVTLSATFRAPEPELGLDGKKLPRRDRKTETEEVGQLLSIRLPHLLNDLPDCGLGRVQALTADDVVERVRTAYNPADRGIYAEARARGLARPVSRWSTAGPAGAEEEFTHYRHGTGASITYEFTGFTTSVVRPEHLLPLLETGGQGCTTRISIIYQPMDPAKASVVVENNYWAAEGRVRDSKKPGARQRQTVHHADRARTAEAQGHALVDFAILVTITVDDIADLPKARAMLNRVGPNARLHLRPMNGLQALGFAQSLGVLGFVANEHLRLPRGLMNGM